jgi:hypothetical protein
MEMMGSKNQTVGFLINHLKFIVSLVQFDLDGGRGSEVYLDKRCVFVVFLVL